MNKSVSKGSTYGDRTIRPNPVIMLGVGGIGSGAFFILNGEHTLGREESRSGHFIDRRDYCKLHIISHYVKILLGDTMTVSPIGKIGDDETGNRLREEMGQTGLNLNHVQTVSGAQTLYSFCILYPDGSGGNLTTDNSACDQLTPEDLSAVEADFASFQSRGIVLAAPEVPLAVRQKLLQLGTLYNFHRVATFTSGEIEQAIKMGLLAETDLLAMNQDEAASAAGINRKSENEPPQVIVDSALARIRKINPGMKIIITAGRMGSWSWDGKALTHVPGFSVHTVSTAGAGDAFLAGVIAGEAAGFTLQEAQELGSLVATHSVTSPHTIDPRINLKSLNAFAVKVNFPLSLKVSRFLACESPVQLSQ